MPPASAPPALRIPMLDLGREFALIREEAMDAIAQVCEAQHFVLGPPAERFEAAAAAFLGVPEALGCASGTDALWLALAALGVGPRDHVVTTPFSFYATVSAILRTGARPVLADVDPQTLNLQPDAADHALGTLPTGSPSALLPVHLYGQCADMDGLTAVANAHRSRIVEDAAQAFGATWHDRQAGSLGEAAAFSFYPTKNLSAFGDAGLITTRDAETADRLRALRNHGMRQRYTHDDLGGAIGWNSRLDGIQAAVLSVKLRRLPAANQRRRELAAHYDHLFQKAGCVGATTAQGVVLPHSDPRGTPIFHQYVVRVPRRDALRRFLAERGIGSEVYYPIPLHLQPSLAFLGYRRGDFPIAEQAAEEVLALPIYPELREDEAAEVVQAVCEFLHTRTL